MGNPLTEAREALVETLGTLGVTCYGAPPEVVSPPAAVLLPAGTWYEQATFGAVRVTYTLTLIATMQGKNAAAMERLEQLTWDATAALEAVANVGPASSPRILKIGPAEVAAADMSVSVHVTTTTAPPDIPADEELVAQPVGES